MLTSEQRRGVTMEGQGGHNYPGVESRQGRVITADERITAGGAEKSHQCHKYMLQYSTFATERTQVRTWGRKTCLVVSGA